MNVRILSVKHYHGFIYNLVEVKRFGDTFYTVHMGGQPIMSLTPDRKAAEQALRDVTE